MSLIVNDSFENGTYVIDINFDLSALGSRQTTDFFSLLTYLFVSFRDCRKCLVISNSSNNNSRAYHWTASNRYLLLRFTYLFFYIIIYRQIKLKAEPVRKKTMSERLVEAKINNSSYLHICTHLEYDLSSNQTIVF